MFCKQVVKFIGAPLDLGQTLSGVANAPQTLRNSGIKDCVECLNWEFEDFGNIEKSSLLPVNFELSNQQGNEKFTEHSDEFLEKPVKNLKIIGEFCNLLQNAVKNTALEKKFPLVIGGDHSIALGSIAGMLQVYPNLVVIWVDAHGDINTPSTSLSGNYHGMPAAHLTGLFFQPSCGFDWLKNIKNLPLSNLVYIGLGNLDESEKLIIKKNKIAHFTMKDIDQIGINNVIKKAIEAVDPENNSPIHLSFDIDACDPSIAPGTGTKSRGGLTYREAHYICEHIAETKRLVSMDLVEISPQTDMTDSHYHGDKLPIAHDATKTVRLGIELISSCLGNSII